MGEHSEGSIVFSKRQSKPSKPLTTIPLRSPFRQPSTFTSAGMTRSSAIDRWKRTACSLFQHARGRVGLAGADAGAEGFRYGNTYGVLLVIPCHFFQNPAAAIVLKHDEIADQGEKPARVKDALQHDL